MTRRLCLIAPSGAHGILAVFAALLLALRTAAAPVLVAADDPGVMTICAGGHVYYISLDGTPVDPNAPKSDPCPYNGVALALDGVDAPDLSPRPTVHAIVIPLPDALDITADRARQNTPRAPPFPA